MYILNRWAYGAEDYECEPMAVSESLEALKEYHAKEYGGVLFVLKQVINTRDLNGSYYEIDTIPLIK